MRLNLHNEKNLNKKEEKKQSLFSDRERTNMLKKHEQQTIMFLVQRIPKWMNSDMLTLIGFLGSVIVFLAFVCAAYCNITFLLFGVLGFAVSWFGDSLDGRLAYYRHLERKNYGFALDIIIDWLGIILIGLGFSIYMDGIYKYLGFGFVVFYGWEMIISLIRYKLSGKYSIDSGIFGPTEVRIIISLILIIEVLIPDSIIYFSIIATGALFISGIIDTKKLLKLGDEADISEKSTR